MAVVDGHYKRRLDDFFGRLLQSGLLEKYIYWVKFMTVTNTRFIPENVTQKKDLITFDSVLFIIRIYVILLSLSMVLFACEVFFVKYNIKRRTKRFRLRKNSVTNRL